MKTETKPHPRADYPVPPVRRFERERGRSVRLLLSMNRCCERAVPLGKATCPDCEENSAGYQAAMTSREAAPWE